MSLASSNMKHPENQPPPPVIAIVSTSGPDKTRPYVDAIVAHGGHPLVISPPLQRRRPVFHGLLLTGGEDLGESHYGRPLTPELRKTLGKAEPERERCEWQLLRHAIRKNIPVLGICRGCQVLNCFSGGALIPDIPIWRKTAGVSIRLPHRHRRSPSWLAHEIKLAPGSLLRRILKKQIIRVNSTHHQAVEHPGKGLKITARAADGIIEAIEHPGHVFWMGVQFHPERLWRRHPEFGALFNALAAAARQRM